MTWVEVVLIVWLLLCGWLVFEVWRAPVRPDLEPENYEGKSRLGLSEGDCLAELRYGPGREGRRRAARRGSRR